MIELHDRPEPVTRLPRPWVALGCAGSWWLLADTHPRLAVTVLVVCCAAGWAAAIREQHPGMGLALTVAVPISAAMWAGLIWWVMS